MSAVDISVVIPVYGSQDTLPELFERLLSVLRATGERFEVIFVDDGSRDDSWKVLCRLCAQTPGVAIAVQLMRNFGQHNALMAGFHHARGDLIVTMDDDLQHPPEEVPALLKAIRSRGLDVVYGCYSKKQHSSWRNVGSVVLNYLYRRIFDVTVSLTSFRVIRRQLLEFILPYSQNYTFIDGLLAWGTQRIGEVSVEHQPRRKGRSRYSLRKLVVLAINLIANFSLLPLQVVSAIGVLTAGAGLTLAVYFLVRYFQHSIVVPGYASIIIAILVLSGVQLLALGVMGEYLGRLLLNVNKKPQYFERQIVGRESALRPSTRHGENGTTAAPGGIGHGNGVHEADTREG